MSMILLPMGIQTPSRLDVAGAHTTARPMQDNLCLGSDVDAGLAQQIGFHSFRSFLLPMRLQVGCRIAQGPCKQENV